MPNDFRYILYMFIFIIFISVCTQSKALINELHQSTTKNKINKHVRGSQFGSDLTRIDSKDPSHASTSRAHTGNAWNLNPWVESTEV